MTALLSFSALSMMVWYVSGEIMLDGRPFFGLMYVYSASMTLENVLCVSLCRLLIAMRAARIA